jgi:(4S)-4-hydroxy-5-phosphonooxypentane-2,3-dione isomerase
MFAVVVTVQIKPEHQDAFIEAMLADATGSVQNEPDCLLFNVVQNADDPHRLHLYEVYRDAAAFERHKETPHFKLWIERVQGWLAKPLDISTGTHLFPTDDRWIKQQ